MAVTFEGVALIVLSNATSVALVFLVRLTTTGIRSLVSLAELKLSTLLALLPKVEFLDIFLIDVTVEGVVFTLLPHATSVALVFLVRLTTTGIRSLVSSAELKLSTL